MLICIMCHLSRSESDHGKCGIKLKLSTVDVHLRVVVVVSLVAMAMGAKNYTEIEESGHFLNMCDTYVQLTPNQHTSGHQYGY